MVNYKIDWSLLKLCLINGLRNLPATITLTLMAVAISLCIGMFTALARYYKTPVISQILTIFLTVLKGTPVMLILLITSLIYNNNIGKIIEYFNLNIKPAEVNLIALGVFVLSLCLLSSSTEAFRGALLSIDKIQFEAGYSVGLTTTQLLRKIVIPQVIPASMPMLMNNLVASFKASALVYTIGIVEVMYGSLQACAKYYSYLEGYIAAAIIFWVLSVLMSFFGGWASNAVRIEKVKSERAQGVGKRVEPCAY
ncbi:MAG: ABC transporter permease subunit [Clostridiales bacterium]|jgi:L-cystine transport system permease protein|nr:ABC transporter permease subunit [Clostridiales bacterium]